MAVLHVAGTARDQSSGYMGSRPSTITACHRRREASGTRACADLYSTVGKTSTGIAHFCPRFAGGGGGSPLSQSAVSGSHPLRPEAAAAVTPTRSCPAVLT